jgi:cyclophilin family peptidyl-prolyl cis-trans isomerase
MTINTAHLYLVTIATARGNIVLCLQPQLAPTTVNNFVTLVRNKFYNGLIFHRVVAGFVIQGGDPLGTGAGGPGYKFNDEPVRAQYVLGAVAMANSGPNTNGSQFFIDIADDTAQLQPLYNLFGNVQSGQAVANSIQQGDVMTSVTVQEQQ